jgi:hypothetical protein
MRSSILEFRWIQFILAQTGFLNYEKGLDGHSPLIASFLCFLGTFTGHWLSAAERANFSFMGELASGSFRFDRHFAQIHFRCFTLTGDLDDTIGSGGLQCLRQRGQITSSALGTIPLRFEERRISIFGVLSDFGHEGTGYKADGGRLPSIFRVLILTEADVNFPFSSEIVDESELKRWPGWGGTVAFQAAIFVTLKIWEKEWNKVLDEIDNCLRFQLDQTMELGKISEWMFDLDFERSRLYFTVLQILRIFGECIRTVSMDLRAFDSLFSTRSMGFNHWAFNPDELREYASNWAHITKHQNDAEERLTKRLSDKTEEVKSLRDGVRYNDFPYLLCTHYLDSFSTPAPSVRRIGQRQ